MFKNHSGVIKTSVLYDNGIAKNEEECN